MGYSSRTTRHTAPVKSLKKAANAARTVGTFTAFEWMLEEEFIAADAMKDKCGTFLLPTSPDYVWDSDESPPEFPAEWKMVEEEINDVATGEKVLMKFHVWEDIDYEAKTRRV